MDRFNEGRRYEEGRTHGYKQEDWYRKNWFLILASLLGLGFLLWALFRKPEPVSKIDTVKYADVAQDTTNALDDE